MAQTTAPNAGLVELLNYVARAALIVDESLNLRLYTNDYTPVPGSVIGDFTQATFGGYAERTIARADWAAPALTLNVASVELVAGSVQWTPTTAGETVYGCYLVGGLTGVVYYAYRFTTPRVVVVGEAIRCRPVISLSSPAGS